jgi:carbamoyltransferase
MHSGFPFLSLSAVLKQTGCDPEEVDRVAVVGLDSQDETLGNYYAKMRERVGKQNTGWTRFVSDVLSVVDNVIPGINLRRAVARRMVLRVLAEAGFSRTKIEFVDHHLAHAASAYFCSGWPNALILTADGKGDQVSHRTCIGRKGRIETLFSSPDIHSIGFFYTVITQFLGFKRLQHEGKVTGLAAYGDRSVTAHLRAPVVYDVDRHTFINTLMTSSEQRFYIVIYWKLLREDPKLLWDLLRTSANIGGRYSQYVIERFCEKHFSNISREHVAAFAQHCLEEEVIALAKDVLSITGDTHVCLAGGTFANVRLNQKIRELPGVENVFIQQAMGDGGLSIGAAQYVYAQNGHEAALRTVRFLRHAYLGTSFDGRSIEEQGRCYGLVVRFCNPIEDVIGRMVADGLIVGRFAGAMEWGPRALGNRSILADPRSPNINDVLNQRLRRSEFMPFAPSILEPHAGEFFEDYCSEHLAARFMTTTYNVFADKIPLVPAVVHVDGTARPQVVREIDNPSYYRIIDAFRRETGIPLLVNTSFNMHEEPIVHSPEDAIRAYLAGAVDVLAMETYLMVKPERAGLLEHYLSGKLLSKQT